MTRTGTVRVWDIVVRTLHWSLAAAFFAAYATGDDESGAHVWLGYAVLAIVAIRIAWGIVGTPHARFADFIYGPTATLRYARSLLSARPIHFVGHNPLGGWMIVALLLTLAAVCGTGILAEAAEGRGPLAAMSVGVVAQAVANDREREHDEARRRGEKEEEGWSEAHEVLAHFALALVVLHIAGALLGSALHRENLIKAMITGDKQP